MKGGMYVIKKSESFRLRYLSSLSNQIAQGWYLLRFAAAGGAHPTHASISSSKKLTTSFTLAPFIFPYGPTEHTPYPPLHNHAPTNPTWPPIPPLPFIPTHPLRSRPVRPRPSQLYFSACVSRSTFPCPTSPVWHAASTYRHCSMRATVSVILVGSARIGCGDRGGGGGWEGGELR